MNTNSENSLVSVIIPAYNSAKYLKETISSVLDQSYRNIELIIVDDGSTDNTFDIVRPFLDDNRCQYHRKANAGVSIARNDGAAMAKGIYLAFLDADDLFYHDSIKEKVQILDTRTDIGLVHSDVQMIDEQGENLDQKMTGLSGYNKHLDLLLWNECVIPAPSSNAMIRKEIFKEEGGYDSDFSTAADQDFLIRICKKHSIYRIEKYLTAYRIVLGSMGKNTKVFERDHLAVYNKAKANGLFPSKRFERLCFSNLHLIIASSWWVHHKNISKTIRHLFLSIKFSAKPVLRKAKKVLT